jgi:hypothetical protein
MRMSASTRQRQRQRQRQRHKKGIVRKDLLPLSNGGVSSLLGGMTSDSGGTDGRCILMMMSWTFRGERRMRLISLALLVVIVIVIVIGGGGGFEDLRGEKEGYVVDNPLNWAMNSYRPIEDIRVRFCN